MASIQVDDGIVAVGGSIFSMEDDNIAINYCTQLEDDIGVNTSL